MEKLFFSSIFGIFIGIGMMSNVLEIDNVWIPRIGCILFGFSLLYVIVISLLFKCGKIGYVIGISLSLFIEFFLFSILYKSIDWIPYNNIAHIFMIIITGVSFIVYLVSSFLYHMVYKYK